MLPILGRLLEKAVGQQLQRHCDTNAIIPVQQFGFRKHSSCELALIAAQDSWIQEVSSGSYVGALMIDISKAFDSVVHEQLLSELDTIGCDNVSLRWFHLDSRVQRVKAGAEVAQWKSVLRGVPQGSPLSPLLFNILVRHLPSASGAECFQFADDLTNSAADPNLDSLRLKLQNIYQNVKQYCMSCNMQINLKKTQLIIFKKSGKKVPDDFQVVLDDVAVIPEKEVKLLGVTIDHHFTMASHISNTVTKCHGLLGVMKRASVYLPRDALKLM